MAPATPGEGGAALLESMLVAPVILAVVLAIFEFGLIYRDVLSVADAAGAGARVGAVLGPRPTDTGVSADFEIIRTVRESLSSIPVEWIERIVVFEAGPPGAGGAAQQVPAACKSGGSVPGLCNVYHPAHAFLAVELNDNDFFAQCPGGAACAWHPFTRSNGPTTYDIDYLGVWIRVNRPYITGLFGETFTFEQAQVVRLEPGALVGVGG